MRNRLHWITVTDPIVYHFFKDGELKMETSDDRFLDGYRQDGYVIEVADNEEIKRKLKAGIEFYENKVENKQG
jgi:hypothetical protein